MKIINFLRKFDEAEVSIILSNLKRTNFLFGEECKSLDAMPYKIVKKTIPELFKDNKFEEIIKLIFWVTDEAIDKADERELLSFILWVKDGLEMISKYENDLLSSSPDIDLINAGINKLDMLGDLPLIDSLAGGDMEKWEAIESMPYHKVFKKMLLNKLNGEINKDYQKIISDKQKRK